MKTEEKKFKVTRLHKALKEGDTIEHVEVRGIKGWFTQNELFATSDTKKINRWLKEGKLEFYERRD